MSDAAVVKTDVLIVGSGAVGVAAAIEAREAGAQVIVIEKADHLGGAAAISGGGCCIAGTPLQRESGIQDSVDLAFSDWIGWGEGSADEVWTRFYLENAVSGLYQWGIDHGVKWVGVMPNEGNTVPRWHRPENGGGGLWNALHKTAMMLGATDWRTSTAARRLLVEDGRVVGVVAENQISGETIEFRAGSVVLGPGGFTSNIDMVLKYRPELAEHRVLEGSHPGNRGEGHEMSMDVGAVMSHPGDIWFYVYAIPDHLNEKRGLVIRGINDAIWVNMQGRRFHNENLTGGATGAPAVMAQDPATCWAVVDSTMIEGVTVADSRYYQPGTSNQDWNKVRELIDVSPYIRRGDSIEALGDSIGVPVDTFVETVAQYNGYIDDEMEVEPDCGRPLRDRRKIAVPPFYALNYYPVARKNLGGIKTDLQCRVLNKHYEPIDGLFAAGEMTGMAGGHINGRNGLEGTMLGPALFSGRVAGAWAASDAGFGGGFHAVPDRS